MDKGETIGIVAGAIGKEGYKDKSEEKDKNGKKICKRVCVRACVTYKLKSYFVNEFAKQAANHAGYDG